MKLLIGVVVLLLFYTAVLLLGIVAGVVAATHMKEGKKDER